MKHQAFISYSHLDKPLVDKLEQELRALGIDVWRDINEIYASQDIQDVIEKAITHNTDILIVALTNNSLAAPWVKWEQERGEQAIAAGLPLEIIYVKLDAKCYVPDDIKRRLFIDLSGRYESKEFFRGLLSLARYGISRNPLSRLGVYDIYDSFSDLDARRENKDGIPGCPLGEFIACAEEEIVAVGLWFGVLFGPDSGAALANFLQTKPKGTIDLYVPDPESAPLHNLALVHEHKSGVIKRIKDFIVLFEEWGCSRGLSQDEADRCRLHLLKLVPTNSYLCIDPCQVRGRMILDIFAVGIEPSRQMKVELRYPETSLFKMYADSLAIISDRETTSRMITASHTNA